MVTIATQTHTATHLPSATSAGIGNSTYLSKDHVAQTDISVTQKQAETNPGKDQLEDLTRQLNTKAQNENLDITFGYDKDLNKVYISVIDKHSGKEIRKLPSDEALKFAKSIKESLGRLLDRRG